MATFLSTLNTTLLLFTFIIIGFILRKFKILPDSSDAVLSKLENNILVPAVVISTFISKCTVENIKEKWTYILFDAIIILVILPIAFALGKALGKDNSEKKIFRYSVLISNFSFFGIPLVSGAFGEDALFDYLIFCLPLYLFCYSFGVAWLIPNGNNKISIKSFINPICISLIIGAVLGLIGVKLPSFLTTAIDSASACMGPIAMILTGFVVAGFDIKGLLTDKRIYLMSAIRLVIIPLAVCGVLKLLKVDQSILVSALCAVAMPLGLNTIVIPAAYGGNTKIGASCALISSVFAVLTIPLMFAIFV